MSWGQIGESRWRGLSRGYMVAMVTGVRGRRSWDAGFLDGTRTYNKYNVLKYKY